MSLRITEDCINCGMCQDVCPTQAIFEDEANGIRVIDPSRCCECVGFYDRIMCKVECPVECFECPQEQQETEAVLLQKAKTLAPDYQFPASVPSHFK